MSQEYVYRRSDSRSPQSKWRPYALAWLLSALVLGPSIYSAVYYPNSLSADFKGYDPFVHAIEHDSIPRPNFLYPLVVAFGKVVLSVQDLSFLHFCITLLTEALLGMTILWALRRSGHKRVDNKRVIVALALLIIGVPSFWAIDGHHYFGWILPTVYHNANIILCKPFALLSTVLLCKLVDRGKLSQRRLIILAVSIVASLLAKPNFVLALLPALPIFLLVQRARQGKIPLMSIAIYIVAPAVAVLAWQYSFTYRASDATPSGILWAPFAIWRDFHFAPKLFLSLLFPIVALALYGKRLWEFARVRFVIVYTCVALVINYCFFESGPRFEHLNFAWTGQIALFLAIVMIVSAILELRDEGQFGGWRAMVVTAVFGLHVLGGIQWYALETLSSGGHW